MSKSKEMLKSTIIYATGLLGSKLLTFLILPLYSRYLTVSGYGEYDTVSTIIMFTTPFITLMFDNAAYVFLVKPLDGNEKESVITYVFQVIGRNCLFAFIIFAIFSRYIRIQYKWLYFAWGMSIVLYSTWLSCCRGMQKKLDYAIAGIINTLIILCVNVIGLVIFKADFRTLIISNLLANCICIIYIEFRLHILLNIRFKKINKDLKRSIIKYSLPLIPNQISWWLLNLSDRLMLVYFCGTVANGFYAMAGKIPGIITIVSGLFSMAWADTILGSRSLKDIEPYANHIYNLFIRTGICLTLCLMSINKFVYKYYIGGDFADSYKYSSYLYIGVLFSACGSLLGAFYGYHKKSANVAISGMLAAVLNVGINFLFMKKYGTIIACISTIISYLAMFLFRFWGLKNIICLKIRSGNIFLMFFLAVPLIVDSFDLIWLHIVMIFTVFFMSIILNLDLLKSLYKVTLKLLKSNNR